MDPSNLSSAFVVWAAVVALIGGLIVVELARLRADFKEVAKDLAALTTRLNDYFIVMERRVAHLEAHAQLTNDDFKPAFGNLK